MSGTDIVISFDTTGSMYTCLAQVRREVTLTPGPVVVRGNMSSRNKKKKKFADYVLSQEPSVPIGVPKMMTYSVTYQRP